MLKTTLIFILFCFTSLSALAHEWSQMFIEHEVKGDQFVATIQFDASYAEPALRDDPDAQQPMRSWLVAKSEQETIALRKEAERYLNTAIHFKNTVSDQTSRLAVKYTFPDWDTTPPNYPTSLDQRAYFTVKLHVPIPAEGTLEMHVPWGIFPTVVFQPATDDGKDSFYSVKPASSYTFLTVEKADSPESAPVITETKISRVEAITHSFQRGFGHVIPEGLDHILFIIAICLVLTSAKKLVHQSLLFTLAHSITFAMLASGYLSLSSEQTIWVERLIALSIFALAIESLFIKKLTWHRYVLILFFGLIHGLGYASAFGSNIENKATAFWSSLIAANIGIEVAQLLIVFAVFLGLKGIKNTQQREQTTKVIAMIIAITAIYLLVGRF